MSPEKAKGRAADVSEPAVEETIRADFTASPLHGQRDLDSFIHWLTDWHEMLVTDDFLLELQRRKKGHA